MMLSVVSGRVRVYVYGRWVRVHHSPNASFRIELERGQVFLVADSFRRRLLCRFLDRFCGPTAVICSSAGTR